MSLYIKGGNFMRISKEILEKAFKESIDNYSPASENDKMTFDNLEKTASEFSDSMMKRAIEMALKESKNSKKKSYARSVENMLSQLDSGRKSF